MNGQVSLVLKLAIIVLGDMFMFSCIAIVALLGRVTITGCEDGHPSRCAAREEDL